MSRGRMRSLRDALGGALQPLSYVLRFPLFLVLSLFPTDERLWVFTAGDGDSFSGNTKYLYLFLHGEDLDEDLSPVWISSDETVVRTLRRNGYPARHRRSIAGRVVLARASVAFLTHGNPLWPYTGNSTVVQTWHGVGLKTMGRDEPVEPSLLERIYRRFVFENWDKFVVTSDGKPAEKYGSAFDLDDDQLLVTGLPRNDALFREFDGAELVGNGETMKLVEELGSRGQVVLYVPTWRRAMGEEAGIPLGPRHLPLDTLDELLAQQGASFVVKSHPMSSVDLDVGGYDHVHLVERDVDIYALLTHVDVLVTDYSSVFVDYLLLDRPVVFYPYDLDEYRDSRGFYFEYAEHTPGSMANTPGQLTEALGLALGDDDGFEVERDRVTAQFHRDRDGESCRRLVSETIGDN